MKNIFPLILVMIATVSCANDQGKDVLYDFNLKGKVKSIRQSNFAALEKDGEIITGTKIDNMNFTAYTHVEVAQFNEDGNMYETNGYGSEGNLIYKMTVNHGENGNLIGDYSYDLNNELINKCDYNYHENGYMSEANCIGENGVRYTLKFKFDEFGNMYELNEYGSGGELVYNYTYKYDKDRNMIEGIWYKPEDSLRIKWTYKYDKYGNWIEKNTYNSNAGNVEDKLTYTYEYDPNNNWTKEITFKDGRAGKIAVREIEYY